MRINQKWAGLWFAVAVILSVGAGPIFFGKKAEAQGYVVPEPAPLSAEDELVVSKLAAPFCGVEFQQEEEQTELGFRLPIEVPVFLYHRVTDADEPSHEVIRPKLFAEHVKYLKDNGYETISMGQLAAFMDGKGSLPSKPVMLTFDDGWKDNMEAAKVLKRYDMGATFYVISGFFGAPMYFSENDVRELSTNKDFEIGSHMHSHFVKWDKNLHTLPLCVMAREMVASKLILERLTGRPITSLAWPYGYMTNKAVYAAGKLGYETTGLVSIDSFNSKGHNPLFIKRLNIDGVCGMDAFVHMLTTKKLRECS